MLGDNAVFPMTEWNLVDIKEGNVMEYECSFIIHRTSKRAQNGNVYISNGHFGVAVVSRDFYHFSSLEGMNINKKKKRTSKKKSKEKDKVESKVHHIIHDHSFNRNCLVVPKKYYGDVKPVCCPFDFPCKKSIKIKVQCRKCVRKGIKERIEWDSRIVIEKGGGDYSKDENRKFEFIQSIGNTENMGRFRIGLLLHAPDAECSNTWTDRGKAYVEAQQVRQL